MRSPSIVDQKRYVGKKPRPKMKPIELKAPPDQTQTITRVVFDIVKEHGPLITIADPWERVKEVGVGGLASKRHLKIVWRWMREGQKLRQNMQSCGTSEAIFVYYLVHKAQHQADKGWELFSTTKAI